MFGMIGLALKKKIPNMAYSRVTTNWTERQRIIGGAAALAAGTICILSLTATGIGSGLSGMLLAVASVVLFVVGTLSIGTSEQEHV